MMHTFVDSPISPILLTGDGQCLTGLYTAEHARRPAELGRRDDAGFEQARAQLAEYFAGDRVSFELALAPAGTEFQQRVWQRLLAIPAGSTRSYGQLAVEIGNPKAVRAVGLANGRNPISIIVPCHRVVGSTGALTGYAGGLAAKQWLLEHERRVSASLAALAG
ncbi:MAG: methylated-DNA--[protein]-cysteine S-methyltransferase [Jatrophihabitantaceae bacterium]